VPQEIKKDQNIVRTDKDLYIDGQRVVFHYNRDERLKQGGRKLQDVKDKKCFLCGKYAGMKLTFVNIILIVILAYIFINVVGKMNVSRDDGLVYLISKKYFTRTPQFNLQIKNSGKNTLTLKSDTIQFEVYNSEMAPVFTRTITISKKNFRPDEFFLENIVTDPFPEGKYKAVLFIEPPSLKKIELEFTNR
jgi:hypothetical protein